MKQSKTICGTIYLEGNCVIERIGDKVSAFTFPSENSAIAYYDKRRIRETRGAKTRRDYHVSYNIPNFKLI